MPLLDSLAGWPAKAAPRSSRSGPFRRRVVSGVICVGAIAAGALTGSRLMQRPLVAIVLLIAGVAACYALAFARALPRVFLTSLGVVLLGYATFGRTFAYIGVAPVFIGEVMFAFGIVAAVAGGCLLPVGRSTVAWLIVLFTLAGAVATLPYLRMYRVDALRDAALWGYGAFAFIVAACVLRTKGIPQILRQYTRFAMPFVVWLPIIAVLVRSTDSPILVPGTGMPLFVIKAGDVGVHLAGIAAFILLELDRDWFESDAPQPWRRKLFWGGWMVALMFVAALNRGGFVAALAALGVLGLMEPVRIGRRLAAYGSLAVLLGVTVLVTSMSLEKRVKFASETEERSLSISQVVENVISITGRKSAGDLSNTREWRLEWWTKIVDYTFFGEYFWTGKGFGVNLADDDGFQVATDDIAPLRSPHNSMMTVLARMGVPGLALWLLLQIGFGLSLLFAHLRARRAGALGWARLNLWILSYWTAFIVNSCFDVFLEGPQGGIWFWSLMGLGIGVLELQRRDIRPLQPRWSPS
jgi:O-Antigen ligase